MSININDPAARREDLVAALKLLLDPEWGSFEATRAALQSLYTDIFGEPLIVADATWSPLAEHRYREVWFSGACDVTLPDDPELPLGFAVPLRRLGAGAVTVTPAAGAQQVPAVATIQRQWRTAVATLVAISGGHVTWCVEGDI